MRLLLAILLLSGAQLGTSIYLPALPAIAADLAIDRALAQQLITLYFLGFGLSQLLFGSLSDALGRWRVFLWGQGLFVLGTLACLVLADSAWGLGFGRLLQGLGAGAPHVLARAILSDGYRGRRLQGALANLAVAAGVLPIFAPLLGGLISEWQGWRPLFAYSAAYLALVLVIGARLLPRDGATGPWSPAHMARTYGQLIQSRTFLTLGLYRWLPYMLMVTSFTFYPFALQQDLGLAADDYGRAMMIPAAGLIAGSLLAKLALRRFSTLASIGLFAPLIALGGLLLTTVPMTVPLALAACCCLTLALGGLFPACLQLMLAPFRHQAGSAVALSGAVEMFLFTTTAQLANRYLIEDLADLGGLYLAVAAIYLGHWVLDLARQRRISALAVGH
ncbi:MFS transporter [Gallaecimonas sp. GXIMD4217]|uniref:MFS transporter n=1 Tax=Gallaecimonas sp. GXIMD4217 TaxID=3131927 RepID=UPI00311B2856